MTAEGPIDSSGLFRLDGQVAIVTGASSGLGRRFARLLHGAGASVAVVARRADLLADLASALPGTLVVARDVAAPDAAEAITEHVVDHFGRIDLLVNNAGISQAGDALDEPINGVAGVLQVNVVAGFDLARRCVPHMRSAGGGRIVFITSMLGLVGCGQTQPSYSASKGALISLTRELAAQWAAMGVRVNAIAPGWFRTELTAEMFDDEKGQRWMARSTPLGRPGADHEVDGALLYLASDASSFVTGQTMVVDGGWTAV